MADTQIKDLDNLGAIAAAADELAIYDSDSSYDKKVNFQDLFDSLWGLARAITLQNTLTLGGKLIGGANEIEGSNFDINGGTIDNVTNVDCDLLTVDNLQLDANTISSTDSNGDVTIDPNGTGDINLTTAGGYVVFIEGDIKIGSTALTATATELNHVDGAVNKVMDVTKGEGSVKQTYAPAASSTTSLTEGGFVSIDTTSGACSVALPIIATGHCTTITIALTVENGALSIIGNAADDGFIREDGSTVGTTITLNAQYEYVILRSSGIATQKWSIIGGSGYSLA